MLENEIICGDCLDILKDLPDKSISCCISSPPYWALRDYGVGGQLGLEKTFEEYIDKLCTIYDEVKRVLRNDGTCFVNLGDTYGGANSRASNGGRAGFGNPREGVYSRGLEKSLCLIPQRFAIEMVNRGWILRNTIIWHKPNPMPSSAKDRFTVDFEYVYFFVKSKKYYFEPQYEPYTLPMNRWGGIYTDGNVEGSKYQDETLDPGQLSQRPRSMRPNALGRNKRTVWKLTKEEWLEWCEQVWKYTEITSALWQIPTQPFSEAHFATYPEKLVEPMIKAGCPEYICSECDKPRVKVYETELRLCSGSGRAGNVPKGKHEGSHQALSKPVDIRMGPNVDKTFKGYTDCGCGAEYESGIVLDPFAGSGTTLQVAARLNRNYLGIELNPEYIEMAKNRILNGETGLSVKEARAGQMAMFAG